MKEAGDRKAFLDQLERDIENLKLTIKSREALYKSPEALKPFLDLCDFGRAKVAASL